MTIKSTQEYYEKARKLRSDPMVKEWIAAYQIDPHNVYGDCRYCSFPHSPHLICGRGTPFGRLKLGGEIYSIDLSNVVFFHDFMLGLGKDWGFHWCDQIFFKRLDSGTIEVRYFEQFNNTPQQKMWHIPADEWASIVANLKMSEDKL